MICLFAFIAGCKKGDNNITEPTTVINDSIPQLPGWKIMWNDEFNGTIVDSSKWEYEVDGNGGGNGIIARMLNPRSARHFILCLAEIFA